MQTINEITEATPAQLSDVAQVQQFVRGGNATFTLVSKATANRHTYRIRASEDRAMYFVSHLRGADNTSDYAYVGILSNAGGVRRTAKSKVSADAPSFKAIDWFIRRLDAGDLAPELVEFWHAGRCGRCGRLLTDPQSIAAGFGPVCIDEIGGG